MNIGIFKLMSVWLLVLGGEFILFLFIGVMAVLFWFLIELVLLVILTLQGYSDIIFIN